MLFDLRFTQLFRGVRGRRMWILVGFILSLAGCHQSMVVKELPYVADVTATVTPNTQIDFETKLRDLENTMPAPSTNTYRIPSPGDQQTFQTIVNEMVRHDLLQAGKLANVINYEILDLTDSGSANSESYVLQEVATPGQGWGIYFFRAGSAKDIVIEAPHPITDKNTVRVALHLYRNLSAKALLVAGSRRDTNENGSADVAHAKESIFQTVHQTLFTLDGQPNTDTIFLQIHGYDSEDHSNLPDVVIGYNWQNDPAKDKLLNRIVKAMQANQLTVSICNQRDYSSLCGTTNIQRQITSGGMFLHLEVSVALRAQDAALIKAFRDALL